MANSMELILSMFEQSTWEVYLNNSIRGENNPNYGNKHTDEQKINWSKQRKGRKLSDKWKHNIKDSHPNYTKENHNNWGKLWISNYNTQERKLIEKEQFKNYLQNGWIKGRKKFQ